LGGFPLKPVFFTGLLGGWGVSPLSIGPVVVK
jgi:hypothetical protein